MGSEGVACDECSQNCLTIHHKHDPSQLISSFFKVMYGKNYADFLILPPRFVKLNSLVDQETYLENSNGQKWNVVLSTINGSLAFQKGWHKFILDHGIEVGDFVVFHYITRSHFVVKIYGRSGCEELNSSSESKQNNNRAKTTHYPVVPTPPRDSLFKTSPPKPDTNTCAIAQPNSGVTERRNDRNPSRKNDSEMYDDFMFDRDISSAHEDDRAHLFDLYAFERINTTSSGMKLETNNCSEDGDKKCRIIEADGVGCSKRIKRLLSEENSMPFTSYPSVNDDKPLSPCLPEMPSGTPPKSDATAASGGGMVDIKKLCQELHRNSVTETSLNVSSYKAKSTSIVPEVNTNTGKVDDNFTHTAKDKDEGETILKQEPADDICDHSPSLALKVTCLVKPDNECFLDLPEKLPLKVPRRGATVEKKVVFLRDQVGRLWPVMYHQTNGVFVLTSGWKSYRKTNNIQIGDECTFMVENTDENTFRVEILRR